MSDVKKRKRRRLRKSVKIFLLFLISLSIGVPLGFAAAYFYDANTKETAYQLVVDGVVLSTTSSKEELETLIKDHISTYTSSTSLTKVDRLVETVQKVEIVETKIAEGSADTIDIASQSINQLEKEANIYTVVSGDNLWNIAIDNEIALSQIIKYNPAIDPDHIWPKDEILFEPENPMIDVSVKYEEKVVEDVMYPTEYIYDDSLYVSQRIVVQKGVMGRKIVTYAVEQMNGYEEDRYTTQETTVVQPTKAIVRVGTKRTLVRTSNTNFGVTSGRFTSSYGYRIHPITGVRTFHDGIDIASYTGTNVYAYTDGVVTTVGYDRYYGRYIVINHGGGLTTIYKHLDSYLVKLGQNVKVGDHIGEMGNTGFSTGSHLHFEVRVNGSTRNPLDYI